MPLINSLTNIGNHGKIVEECAQSGSDGPLGGVCATLVARWIKYKLAKANFWDDKSISGRSPYWQVTLRGNSFCLIPSNERKAALLNQHSQYKEILSSDNSSDKSIGKYVASSLTGLDSRWRKGTGSTKNHKLQKAGIKAISYLDSDVMQVANPDQIIDFVKNRMPKSSLGYISLRPALGTGDVGHALGIHRCEDGSVSFYDPNLAEISLNSPEDFAHWWKDAYLKSWEGSSYEKYQRYSSQLQVAVIRGHLDLSALNREVAERQANLDAAIQEQIRSVREDIAQYGDDVEGIRDELHPIKSPRSYVEEALRAQKEKSLLVLSTPNKENDISAQFDEILLNLSQLDFQ